jgi:hypothetical protein
MQVRYEQYLRSRKNIDVHLQLVISYIYWSVINSANKKGIVSYLSGKYWHTLTVGDSVCTEL